MLVYLRPLVAADLPPQQAGSLTVAHPPIPVPKPAAWAKGRGEGHGLFPHALQRVALLGNHRPRQCGIATFMTDLGAAIA